MNQLRQTIKTKLFLTAVTASSALYALTSKAFAIDRDDIINTDALDETTGAASDTAFYIFKSLAPFITTIACGFFIIRYANKSKEDRSNVELILGLAGSLAVGIILTFLENIISIFNIG